MALLPYILFPAAFYMMLHLNSATSNVNDNNKDVLVLTVASNVTDGYKRYVRSASVYGIKVKTLGLGEPWKGGHMQGTGGGQKVNLFKQEVAKHSKDRDKIILFTDSYDVIFLGGVSDIVERFKQLDAKVVFGAESFCWPDKTLAAKYPQLSRGKQYLNSGGIIGYAPELHKLLTYKHIDDSDDDQLFYTEAYLDEGLRSELKMKLDHKSLIFHNLHGATDEVSLKTVNQEVVLENTAMKTLPLILHGNGPFAVKQTLNRLGNYLARAWSSGEGCLACREDVISLQGVEVSKQPVVFLAIFISKPTPFLEEFFRKIQELQYPKKRMNLFVYNNVDYHEPLVAEFIDKHAKAYRSWKRIKPSDDTREHEARTLAIEQSVSHGAELYFNVDSEAHLDNPYTLVLLIEQNRSVVAPMLARPYKPWSNFWGDLTEDGFYARSADYMDIVNNEKRGLWNVPYVSAAYLVNSSIILDKRTKPNYVLESLDHDMAFCWHLRNNGVFLHVSNRVDFGHLVNPESYDISKTHPDFYQVVDNRWDWGQRYLHENYSENFKSDNKPLQPCPDVFWFPVASPRFCADLVDIMEAYGRWSDGSNKDTRLDGGYENVPTRDIHMKQVGLNADWLQMLKDYVRPLQEVVFNGYYHNDERLDTGYEAVPTRDIHLKQVGLDKEWLYFLDKYVAPLNKLVYIGYHEEPPRSLMNFVVRYRPDEQPSLRPHHDSSTYTINLALNTPIKDYEGGGCRFLRYNCSVTETRQGWLLMHPGRLTHYHEGLPVTKGTRYIMISFIDP